MIQLQTDGDDVLLPVRVTPSAKRATIGGEHDGALKISVTVVAEGGKANRAVIQSLAKKLKISRSSITIERGATARRKLLRISSFGDEVKAAIERLS